MADIQRTGLDPSPLKSKKFLAFLICDVTWKALSVVVLFWGKDSMPGMVFGVLIAIILVAGFMEALFIGGQASIDKYVRVAEIAVGTGHEMSIGALQIKHKASVKSEVLDAVKEDNVPKT